MRGTGRQQVTCDAMNGVAVLDFFMRTRPAFFTLALLLLTGACGDSSNESATETSDSASSTTADDSSATSPGTTSLPTTGEGTTSSDSATSDGTGTDGTTTATATDTGETTATTDSETTGGPIDPDIQSGCEAYCGRWAECGFPSDLESCISGCIESIGPVEGACKAAHQDQLACTVGLTCEQLFDAPGEGGPCAAEVDAIASACGGNGECSTDILGGEGECALSLDCVGEPLQEMKCDATTCACLVDGKQVGECAADGICVNDIEGIMAKAQTCCGV